MARGARNCADGGSAAATASIVASLRRSDAARRCDVRTRKTVAVPGGDAPSQLYRYGAIGGTIRGRMLTRQQRAYREDAAGVARGCFYLIIYARAQNVKEHC